jgi:hypothetical protein
MIDRSAVAALQTENARLTALLEAHGIEWRVPQPTAVEAQGPEPSRLSTAEKVTLFRRLFRGRTDVFPVRWEGKTSGKSGYAPACANEWLAGVCEKPRIKCGDCRNRLLIPLTDAVIYDHLAGEHTVGVYPLLEVTPAIFWRSTLTRPIGATMYALSCSPVKSWVCRLPWRFRDQEKGAHAWVFFASRVPPGMPGAWALPSSAIPALAPGN